MGSLGQWRQAAASNIAKKEGCDFSHPFAGESPATAQSSLPQFTLLQQRPPVNRLFSRRKDHGRRHSVAWLQVQ
jgi:hypothetical protein